MSKETIKYYNINISYDDRFGREVLPKHFNRVTHLTNQYLTSTMPVIIELGSGKGAMKNIHNRYIGLDISYYAIKKYLIGSMAIQADMEDLPIKDNMVDFLFSIASIEHVPRPEEVFAEIDRVLKYEGIAYIAPAWFIKQWAAKGLPIKKYSELGWLDIIRKFLIPLREHILFKGLFVIPKRLLREFSYALFPKPITFKYKQLQPNLEDYVYDDCDAFASMDPHMAIMYFLSRDYEILNGGDKFFKRIFYRHEYIVVIKRLIKPKY